MYREINVENIIVSKNKLSKNQQRRVSANHEQRRQRVLNKPDNTVLNDDADSLALFGEPSEGVVISRFGKSADVEDSERHISRCSIRRTLPSIVTGDRVIWRASLDGQTNGIIEAVQDRTSELVRPDFYDGVKPVAANVDQIIIVSSVVPDLSLTIIDRYLVACETMHIQPIIVLNKVDLLNEQQLIDVKQLLSLYSKIGYQVLYVSGDTRQGMEELENILKDRVSIFVGQSGVGKSSLINLLLPERISQASVGAVSETSGLGQHTTTTARLYHLVTGGEIIDSPGVREFGLWHLDPQQIIQGFIEFNQFAGQCQFRDCKHLEDPGCALQEAVQLGKIAASRFDHYHRILESMAEVKAKTNRTYK